MITKQTTFRKLKVGDIFYLSKDRDKLMKIGGSAGEPKPNPNGAYFGNHAKDAVWLAGFGEVGHTVYIPWDDVIYVEVEERRNTLVRGRRVGDY